MIQRLAGWLAGALPAGADTAGWVTRGAVAGGVVGAGVVVGDTGDEPALAAAARTLSVAVTPRLPPPQRPPIL
jgi:uncharacterized membrane protein YeaQ/YmgE (transglycosylase-associated protein family)